MYGPAEEIIDKDDVEICDKEALELDADWGSSSKFRHLLLILGKEMEFNSFF